MNASQCAGPLPPSALALPEPSFWRTTHADIGDPPGTIVLFRRNESGHVVLRHVRGEQPHPVGTHVNLDVQTTLQRHVGTDPRQITQPSAVQHPLTGRTHVARATFDGSAGRTMIHTSSATHPTILAHVTTSSFDRAVVIDSAVVLTHFNGELLLAWQEG